MQEHFRHAIQSNYRIVTVACGRGLHVHQSNELEIETNVVKAAKRSMENQCAFMWIEKKNSVT